MNVSEPGLAHRRALLEPRSDDPAAGQESAGTPKILFVINSLEGGGAERVFCSLVNSASALLTSATIDVVLLDAKPNRYEIDPSINVSCLNSNGSGWDSAQRFRRYVAAQRPQLVISFLPRANYIVTAFAQLYGYRCIISERSDTGGRVGSGVSGWLQKQLLRLLYPRADRVICVAEGMRRDMVNNYGVAPEAACAIHNPFDLAKLDQLGRQPCALEQDLRLQHGYIVAVGRLVDVKRFDVLINAYAQGNFRLPLVILGEGPLLEKLQHLAATLGVSERVIFPGFLSNPYAVMARASLFVMTSQREGFPNALVEAMALGTPVIAASCNHGPAEILDDAATPAVDHLHHAKYGLLVPTGDIAALADALQQVLTDEPLRISLAQRARERASHFDAQAAMSRYAAVINEQLAFASQLWSKA